MLVQSESELFLNLVKYIQAPNLLKYEALGQSHHIKLHKDIWGMTSWNAGTVSFNPLNIIAENEQLLRENYNDLLNGLNTTVRPKKFEPNDNVILIQGMKESIDRDIGIVSTKLDWNSIGSSATAESESQTDLQTEFTNALYARKVFSTAGSSARVNQTMKLGMLWDSGSFNTLPTTIRESGIHWALTGTLKCHARVVSTAFVLDSGDLFVVQINELQENGTL